MRKVVAWPVVSLMINEEQSQNCALLFATTSLNLHQRINEHFCCPTSWSRKVKHAKHRPKTSNETMLRETKDFVSYFAAFTLVWVAGRPIFVIQLSFVLAFSGLWYMAIHCLKLDVAQWAKFVTAGEQKAIKAIFTMFTSEFKTFDVVLNTWLPKSDEQKTWLFF